MTAPIPLRSAARPGAVTALRSVPDKKCDVKLYLDGELVHNGVTRKFEAPTTIPPSLILGAEIFYLHDAC